MQWFRRRGARRAPAGAGLKRGFWIGCGLGASVGMAVVVVTPVVVLAAGAMAITLWLCRRAVRAAPARASRAGT